MHGFLHIPVLHDGPGDELGEHGHVHPEVQEVPLHLSLAPVHIDGVGHGLEGVEGDADGQPQGEQRDLCAQDRVHAPNQEIRVFEEAQHPQVDDHRGQ